MKGRDMSMYFLNSQHVLMFCLRFSIITMMACLFRIITLYIYCKQNVYKTFSLNYSRYKELYVQCLPLFSKIYEILNRYNFCRCTNFPLEKFFSTSFFTRKKYSVKFRLFTMCRCLYILNS